MRRHIEDVEEIILDRLDLRGIFGLGAIRDSQACGKEIASH